MMVEDVVERQLPLEQPLRDQREIVFIPVDLADRKKRSRGAKTVRTKSATSSRTGSVSSCVEVSSLERRDAAAYAGKLGYGFTPVPSKEGTFVALPNSSSIARKAESSHFATQQATTANEPSMHLIDFRPAGMLSHPPQPSQDSQASSVLPLIKI